MAYKKMRNMALALGLAACGVARGATVQVALVNMADDMEITVAAGDRYEICTLSSADIHTLTKKGEGDLYVGRVTSTHPRISLQGGRLFVGPKLTEPAVLASADFHVDANDVDSMTIVESDGKQYVTRWNDVNGGAHYAYNDTPGVQPWLTTTENGNRMLDFGSLKNTVVTSGYGGYLLFDSKITGVRAAVCVQKFLPETIEAPESICSQGISCYDQCVFTPNIKSAGNGPSYANKWQGFTRQVRGADDNGGLGGSISVNGNVLSSVLTAASSDIEVVGYNIVEPEAGGTDYGSANRFARNFWDASAGGMMIGEAAIFTTALTDDHRRLLDHYLMAKWIDYGVPSQDQVSVGEGTSAFFWNGTSYDVVEYKEPNVFQSELNVTADTTLEVHAGVTNEIYVLKGGAHTLTKTGLGVLKIVQVEATDLTLDIQGGEVLFDDPSAPGSIFLDAVLRLDADDETTLTTESESGRTLVTRWNDVNGGAIYATAGTVAPYLTNDNGRTYVDFGTLRTSSGEGYGGRMTLSAALTGFREVLAVVRPSDDVYALSSGGIAPVGSASSWTAFMPGSNTSGNWPPIINVYQNVTKQLRDGIYVDGVKGSTAGDGQRWSQGVHVYDFRLAEPEEGASDCVKTDSIGNDRGISFGGFRLGEMVVFSRQLSASDRALAEAYLSVKWRTSAKEFKFANIKATAGGTLTIANGARVTTGDIDAGAELDVRNGTFALDPLAFGTVLRLDAMKAASCETSASDGKTLVTRWNDANGGSTYATADTVAPYLTNDEGRVYLDFGTLRSSSIDGYGGSMALSEVLKGFREVFAVVRPSEDVYDISGFSIAPIGSTGEWTSFLAGANSAGAWPFVINVYQLQTKQLRDGIYVDGVKGSTAGGGQRWLSGVHVYDFRLDEPENVELASDEAEVNAVGNERRNAYGGFRLGELVVYPAQLNAAERTRRQLTLMAKWLGAAGCTQRVESISVAAGAAVSMPYVNVEVDGVLALAGTVEAQSVKASVIAPLSTSAAVTGILDLTEPGVVRIDQSLYGDAINEGYVRIVAAPSVVGSVRLWRVENLAGGLLKLRTGADGLYATGKVSGLGIIFR